jgi:hypothetical protein
MMIDGTDSGAIALDGVLESAEALVPDSLEAELQDDIPSVAIPSITPSIASRLTVDAAIRVLTRYIASLALEAANGSTAHSPAINQMANDAS